jgi:DNA (cytosine-5)-methyltransferase 1
MRKSSALTVTDQFCGAGGSSLGAVAAGAELVLALNHWDLAVETHNTNFPNALHECTDIQACDPRRYPRTDLLITSPECVNHSQAKGRKRKQQAQLHLWEKPTIDPAAERSRATMLDVPRFAEYHQYECIIVENVVEAREWILFDEWLLMMQKLGYRWETVYFNSMFAHPTPQSRDRMYVVFWKKGNPAPDLRFTPLAWCAQCGKNGVSVLPGESGKNW